MSETSAFPPFTLSGTITGEQASSFASFLPKWEPRFYVQWSTEHAVFRALLTEDEARALGRGQPVEMPGLELLMYGTWVACPRTNEALREQWYFTGQYVEDDETAPKDQP